MWGLGAESRGVYYDEQRLAAGTRAVPGEAAGAALCRGVEPARSLLFLPAEVQRGIHQRPK
eukprot:3188004-Rhodomonas_salina.4